MFLGTLIFFVPPFLPQTADLPFIVLKCATLILLGTTLIYAFRKYSEYKIYYFILFIFLMRIGFNFTYLPALANESDQLVYRDHIEKMLKITGEKPVHWYGVPNTFKSDASIGPFTLKEVKLTSAGILAYQIPYYLTKGNQHIMKFDTSFYADQFYLARKDELILNDKSVKVLYNFTDKFIDREMILFKTDSEGK